MAVNRGEKRGNKKKNKTVKVDCLQILLFVSSTFSVSFLHSATSSSCCAQVYFLPRQVGEAPAQLFVFGQGPELQEQQQEPQQELQEAVLGRREREPG